MNHKMKKAGKWVGVFVIAAILVAGGFRIASKEESAKSSVMSEETYRLAEGEAAIEDAAVDTAEIEADGVGRESGSVYRGENPEQKMIVTWDISIETEQYQTLMEQIVKSVEERQGYIESEAEKAMGDDCFSLNGKQYIRADENVLAARHIQEEQVENLSDKNLGDRIGIIEEAADESLIGCEVYSLADVLEQEDMYIVVKGEEYLLYVLWQ